MSKRLLAMAFFTPIIFGMVLYFLFLSPVDPSADTHMFTVKKNSSQLQIIDDLFGQSYFRNPNTFKVLYSLKRNTDIQPGGYYISKSMNLWQLVRKLSNSPDLIWLTFSPGLRKEQIGQILVHNLNWPDEELEKWNTVYTTTSPEYTEGVYFPDTYLIPVDETGQQIADRMIRNFNDKLAPLMQDFVTQNIKWTTGLKIASLLQRESGGSDMPLIAGIIWNRLAQNMKLDLDATVQYARGETASGWWSPPSSSDIKVIDSPYNTYKYKDLPPTPICNPSLEAIKAVLYPDDSDCIFYLHDSSAQIHCAKTYQEHLKNIDKYL